MPLFSNKFSPKKTPARRVPVSLVNKDLSPQRIEREFGPDVGPIRLRLGDQEATFDAGTWIPESGKVGGTFRENEKLKKELRRLEEENNLLKVKFELLLNMSQLQRAVLINEEIREHKKNIIKLISSVNHR